MKWSNKLILLVFSLVVISMKADLPVHCLSNNIEGYWLIHMSNNNHDKTIKCGHEHPDENLDHLNSLPEKDENFKEHP